MLLLQTSQAIGIWIAYAKEGDLLGLFLKYLDGILVSVDLVDLVIIATNRSDTCIVPTRLVMPHCRCLAMSNGLAVVPYTKYVSRTDFQPAYTIVYISITSQLHRISGESQGFAWSGHKTISILLLKGQASIPKLPNAYMIS